jgi:NADH:ubiquinone oxidoreductase subunit E
MEKISVEICTGTACYCMGGADLLLLEEHILEQWKDQGADSQMFADRIKFRGAPCCDACRSGTQKPPFVRINGTLIGQADLEKVLDIIHPLFFTDENIESR